MRADLLAGVAAAIGVVPLGGLLILILTGSAQAWPALLVMLAVVVASLALAAVLARDIHLLGQALRAAAQEDRAAVIRATDSIQLWPIERIARTFDRMSRTLASRAQQVVQLLRANEAIVERLPDPLIVMGTDRTVRRANAAARTAFGADVAAVMRHPGMLAAIDRAFDQGTPQSANLSLPVPVPREVQATVLVMDPPLGDGGHAIAVLSDRTRERAVERMRADFVANASHELRTPLASLIGFIDTLRGPAADDLPAQRRFLGIMSEQAERMNRLIDDLLSLSRIELTEHQPPSQRVALDSLVRTVAAEFEPRVASRRISLHVSVADDLPRIVADADQITQVLQNLIDNAVKYGREGGHVRVSAGPAAPGGRWPARPGIVVVVSDDGPGIARAHVPRLTERFYRVDKGRSRGAGGTGLGLAIVKHVVNRHRGLLVIESEETRGSTFSVWLPSTAERAERSRA